MASCIRRCDLGGNAIRGVVIAIVLIALGGCSAVVHKPLVAPSLGAGQEAKAGGRKIAIFFDGTHNDASSDTNVKKLHSLVSLQDGKPISTLYIEGVGTGTDVLGMGAGLGIGARVRIAYAFLLDNYRPGDKIYIFGFSRGAYSARILVSLLYHAGFPTVQTEGGRPPVDSKAVADIVFDAVKEEPFETSPFSEANRQARVTKKLSEMGLDPDPELVNASNGVKENKAVTVEVLGLWDTVEALGIPDWGPKTIDKLGGTPYIPIVGNANPRYGDKLCNVHHVFHALSLDDDREWVFTPQLMTRRYLFNGCTPKRENPILDGANFRKGHLHEVWFAGAHSDVGGGYADSLLSGTGLNWMIERVRAVAPGLLPSGETRVRSDYYGTSHDPEGGWFWSALYHGLNRDVVKYALDTAKDDDGPASPVPQHLNRGVICVHTSVLERRMAVPPKSHEYRQLGLKARIGADRMLKVDLVADENYMRLGRLREKTDTDGDKPVVGKVRISECKDGIE